MLTKRVKPLSLICSLQDLEDLGHCGFPFSAMQGSAAFAAPFIADTPTITMSRLKAILTVSTLASYAEALLRFSI